MEQLGFLAVPAQQLENEEHEKNVEFGHESRSVAWDIEKKLLQQRNEELKSEIEELKRKRLEDMKANQRLLSIFDSKEEAWKVEKRKLQQELQDAMKKANGIIYTNSDHIDEHHDPAMVAELKEKKHKLEVMLKNAMVETAAWKRNAALKAKEKMNVDVVLRKVTEELLKLQKEVNDRDDIISALYEKKYSIQKDTRLRDTVEAELKAMELQLSNAKSLLKHYTDAEQTREAEVVKWKKLYLAIKAEFEILQRQCTHSYALNANAGRGVKPFTSVQYRCSRHHHTRTVPRIKPQLTGLPLSSDVPVATKIIPWGTMMPPGFEHGSIGGEPKLPTN